MRFTTNSTKPGVRIPEAALALCGLKGELRLDLHTLANAAVIMKERMTGGEVLALVDQLCRLQEDLLEHLDRACGPCDDNCSGFCPFEARPPFFVPSSLLKEADIPADARLCAIPDAEEGTITIVEAEDSSGHLVLPPGMMSLLAQRGICFGRLDNHLQMGDIVYGAE